MIVWHLMPIATVPLVLAFGAAIGLVNAFLIVRLQVPDLLATLADDVPAVGPAADPDGRPFDFGRPRCCPMAPRRLAPMIRPFC